MISKEQARELARMRSQASDDQDQLERAQQKWALCVDEPPTPEVLTVLRSVLNVKRFELPELAGRLPGAVRRGARRDLEPFCRLLQDAGVRAEVRLSRREGTG